MAWYIFSMAIRFDKDKLAALARQRGMSAAKVLKKAGVSRNAYYNLLRKNSLLPKSVEQIAEILDVELKELLVFDESTEAKMRRKMLFVQKLVEDDPSIDIGTAMITLKLLELTPLERLEIGLSYGKAAARYRRRTEGA